ncbi:MAG: hypothetical protein ABEI13_00395 [Candidatus Paceibacteria bacterium]
MVLNTNKSKINQQKSISEEFSKLRVFKWGLQQIHRFTKSLYENSEEGERVKAYPIKELNRFLEICKQSPVKAYQAEKDKNDKILVEALLDHPVYQLRQALVAVYISNIMAKPVGVIIRQDDPKKRKLFTNLGVREVIDFYEIVPKVSALKYLYSAYSLLNSATSKDQIVKTSINNINIGRSIYSSYLRSTGRATINKKDSNLFHKTLSSYTYVQEVGRFVDEKNYSDVIIGTNIYSPYFEIGESFISNGGVVWSVSGRSSHTTVRRYEGETLAQSPFNIRKSDLNDIGKKKLKSLASVGKKEIEKRVKNKVEFKDRTTVKKAFGEEKDIVTEDAIRRQFGWSKKKPIVCVMSHALTDAVHKERSMLYTDYYTWLKDTANKAEEVEAAYWLFKAHPNESNYNTERGAREIVNNVCSSERVAICPDYVNTASLLEFISVVITVRGTAGLEFSCYGIPAVLAGESIYSGLGFTQEPSSVSEYREVLANISSLSSLSESQIQRARAAAGIRFGYFGVQSSILPVAPPSFDFDWSDFWISAAENIEDKDPEKDPLYVGLREQIRTDDTHLKNPEM